MTRPRRLVTMPGDHDFPQASGANTSSNITGLLTPNTDITEGIARRRIMRTTSRSRAIRVPADGANATDIAEIRRRGARIREVRSQEMNLLRAVGENFISSAETEARISAIRSRPRATPNEGILSRHRSRQHMEEDTLSTSISSVHEAVERLTQASSNLSSLLDEPIPRLSSDIDGRRYSGDADANRRHTKRRKLDSDEHGESFKSYGYHGQVVPGPLKMDIVKCDGGRYSDTGNHPSRIVSYCSENILSNDKSVYCTESSKCNIILGHQGHTPFCLKKLVIKAPATGFTAPIQEGLIFISMTANDMLTRTTQYHLREPSPPPPPGPPPAQAGNEEDSHRLHNARSEVDILQSDRRPPSRRADYLFTRTIPAPVSNTIWVRPENERISNSFPLIDFGDDSTPPPRTMSPPIPPLFNVTTNCDAPSGDEEEESHPAILADRSRRDREVSPVSSEDDEDYGDRWVINGSRGVDLRRRRRGNRRATPSKLELTADDGDEDVESEVRKKVDVLAPHARFFIEKDKSMVSVKFDPPVSGRYILLKLWSPARDQNIDIQSIIAHGYAGTRWFPAVQMM